MIRKTRIGSNATQSSDMSKKLRQARGEIAKKNGELSKVRRKVVSKDQELAKLQATSGGSDVETQAKGIRPENIIWIFGTARTGSTWLSSLIGNPREHEEWREPYVGDLFGSHYYKRAEGKDSTRRNEEHWELHWILGGVYREVWIDSIRSFVLKGARARFPEMTDTSYLVVKEPHGSVGVPLLMEALPESRMIFLIRDSRDVAASALDARKKGSRVYKRHHDRLGGKDTLGDVPLNKIVKERAKRYSRDVGKVKAAYEDHKGYKILVRYEDLRADTLGTMKRIYHTLNVTIDEEELARAIEKHTWTNIPEHKKGEGKFFRKATPGGWREDLTPEQIKIVEGITAPFLHEYYGYEASEPNLRFAE